MSCTISWNNGKPASTSKTVDCRQTSEWPLSLTLRIPADLVAASRCRQEDRDPGTGFLNAPEIADCLCLLAAQLDRIVDVLTGMEPNAFIGVYRSL